MKVSYVLAAMAVVAGGGFVATTWLGPETGESAKAAGNFGLVASAQAQPPAAIDKDSIVKPTLMADTTAVQPGTTFTLGILYKIQPDWHIYYKSPGASGFATTVKWGLPAGSSMSETKYPAPMEFESPGPVISFGYEGETMLMVEASVANAPENGKVEVTAKTRWLMCSDRCIPYKKDLTLSLPVGKGEPANSGIFAKYGKQVPTPVSGDLPKEVSVKATPSGSTVQFEMIITPPAGKQLVADGTHGTVHPAYFFPADQDGYVIEPPRVEAKVSQGPDKLKTYEGPVKLTWKAEPSKNTADPLKRLEGTLVYQTVTGGKPDKPILLEVNRKIQ